jgi:hypothetical protein
LTENVRTAGARNALNDFQKPPGKRERSQAVKTAHPSSISVNLRKGRNSLDDAHLRRVRLFDLRRFNKALSIANDDL